MQLGKMYLVKELFWLLFPTKEMARLCGSAMRAMSNAKWLSGYYNCNVFVVKPNTYVVLLEESERCYKLLDCNGNIGWISYCAFSEYFEFVKE